MSRLSSASGKRRPVALPWIPSSLPVPPEGKIPVAIVLGKNEEVLDFCGPLEVFAWGFTKDRKRLFAPYMVAATLEPVTVGGGMRVVPDHTFRTAPPPKIIVIPAMNEPPPRQR